MGGRADSLLSSRPAAETPNRRPVFQGTGPSAYAVRRRGRRDKTVRVSWNVMFCHAASVPTSLPPWTPSRGPAATRRPDRVPLRHRQGKPWTPDRRCAPSGVTRSEFRQGGEPVGKCHDSSFRLLSASPVIPTGVGRRPAEWRNPVAVLRACSIDRTEIPPLPPVGRDDGPGSVGRRGFPGCQEMSCLVIRRT